MLLERKKSEKTKTRGKAFPARLRLICVTARLLNTALLYCQTVQVYFEEDRLYFPEKIVCSWNHSVARGWTLCKEAVTQQKRFFFFSCLKGQVGELSDGGESGESWLLDLSGERSVRHFSPSSLHFSSISGTKLITIMLSKIVFGLCLTNWYKFQSDSDRSFHFAKSAKRVKGRDHIHIMWMQAVALTLGVKGFYGCLNEIFTIKLICTAKWWLIIFMNVWHFKNIKTCSIKHFTL